jgi:hypothetical protein
VAAAQDTGGEAAAGKFYDRAHASFPALVDERHLVSSLYHLTNVPSGVWIDESGRIVRPGETAYSTDRSLTLGGKKLTIEGDAYVAALRDWVANGATSKYALSGAEVARRVHRLSPAEAEAEASFQLGVHFFKAGNNELAAKYWQRAQALNPESWNYHRQEWSFAPQEAGKKWMAKFLALGDRPYYPPLDLPKEKPPEKK